MVWNWSLMWRLVHFVSLPVGFTCRDTPRQCGGSWLCASSCLLCCLPRLSVLDCCRDTLVLHLRCLPLPLPLPLTASCLCRVWSLQGKLEVLRRYETSSLQQSFRIPPINIQNLRHFAAPGEDTQFNPEVFRCGAQAQGRSTAQGLTHLPSIPHVAPGQRKKQHGVCCTPPIAHRTCHHSGASVSLHVSCSWTCWRSRECGPRNRGLAPSHTSHRHTSSPGLRSW